MANFDMLDSLKKESLQVYSGMTVVYPQFHQEYILDVSELKEKFDGCFSVNNGKVCFVREGVFVTPFTQRVKILVEAGMARKSFHVPFSNGDYPKEEEFKWESLCKKARQS